MMSAYSEDLRRRIVSAVQDGMPKARAAITFRVSLSSVKRYVQKAHRGESLASRKSPGSAPKLGKKARKLLEGGLRGLRREGPRARPARGTDSGDGQARGAPAQEDRGAHRGQGLRTLVPAFLLPGLQSHRRGLRQDHAPAARGRGQEQGDTPRSDRRRALSGKRGGRP